MNMDIPQLSCGAQILRILFVIFNVVFGLLGAAGLGLGIFALVNIHGDVYSEGDDISIRLSAGIMTAVGGLLCISGFFGCCGACTKSSRLMYVFVCLATILLCASLGTSVLMFVKRSHVDDSTLMKESMEKADYNTNNTIAQSWDDFQKEHKCCGSNGTTSWDAIGTPIPSSCYDKDGKPYETGCKEVMKNVMLAQGLIFVFAATAELLAIIFGCCLAKAFASDD